MNAGQEERIVKAFANRRRIAIVRYLKSRKNASVGAIADAIRLSFKATSKHLSILSAASVVDREQNSLTMLYRINGDAPTLARKILESL